MRDGTDPAVANVKNVESSMSVADVSMRDAPDPAVSIDKKESSMMPVDAILTTFKQQVATVFAMVENGDIRRLPSAPARTSTFDSPPPGCPAPGSLRGGPPPDCGLDPDSEPDSPPHCPKDSTPSPDRDRAAACRAYANRIVDAEAPLCDSQDSQSGAGTVANAIASAQDTLRRSNDSMDSLEEPLSQRRVRSRIE